VILAFSFGSKAFLWNFRVDEHPQGSCGVLFLIRNFTPLLEKIVIAFTTMIYRKNILLTHRIAICILSLMVEESGGKWLLGSEYPSFLYLVLACSQR